MSVVYHVEFTPAAKRQLKKLNKPTQKLLIKKVEELQLKPRPLGAKKLTGLNNLYRVRVAKSYRIIYQIQDKALIVLVVKIGDRKEIYRQLDNLKK